MHQFVQGGSSGDPILAEFYVKYVHKPFYPHALIYPNILLDRFGESAKRLGVSLEELYEALLANTEIEPDDDT